MSPTREHGYLLTDVAQVLRTMAATQQSDEDILSADRPPASLKMIHFISMVSASNTNHPASHFFLYFCPATTLCFLFPDPMSCFFLPPISHCVFSNLFVVIKHPYVLRPCGQSSLLISSLTEIGLSTEGSSCPLSLSHSISFRVWRWG